MVRSIQNQVLFEYIYFDKNFDIYPKEKKNKKLAEIAPMPNENWSLKFVDNDPSKIIVSR